MTDQQLPASESAERAVLGAVLMDNGCVGQVETLTPEHFSLDSHRKIYRLMLEMWADGVAVDIVTLGEVMRSREQLESTGGYAYIASLTDGVPPRPHIEHYVKILHDKAQLRRLIAEANRTIARALEQTEKPGEIASDLQSAIIEIGADTAGKDQDIMLDVSKFIRQYHDEIEWRVEGAIEVGTNGVLIGMSGDGKSPAARALAVCLASGMPWMGLGVKRCRTALISREDYAGTTSRFIRRFIKGSGIDEDKLNLKDWLWISSRAQVPSLLLDNPSDLRLLINNLKRRKVEFCILDVLNVMHSKDENDNSEMRKVLACIDHLRDEVGCQVMVLHHSRKGADANTAIAEAGRGSSAIAGFAEFKILIRTEDEDLGVKQIRFKTKAGEGQRSFYWRIADRAYDEVTLERTEWTPTKGTGQKRATMSM